MDESGHTKHLRSMDVLKGMIIVIVVCGHVFFTTRSEEGGGGGMPVIVQALYLGLMAFFILSGYFYRPDRGFKKNMLKRLKQIAIPIVICGVSFPLIMYVWLLINGYDLPFSDYLGAVVFYLGFNNVFTDMSMVEGVTSLSNVAVGIYFLGAMLWGFLIFYALADHVMDDKRKVVVTIVGLLIVAMLVKQFVTITLPVNMDLGPLAAAFMFIGALLAKFNLLENMEYGNKKDVKYWIIPIVCLAAGMVLCFLLPPDIRFDRRFFGDYGALSIIPFFIEATLMFIPIAYIGFLFSKIPGLSSLFNILGQHTLAIMLVHALVIKMLVVLFYDVDPLILVPDGIPFWFRIIVIVAALTVSVFAGIGGTKLLERLKEANKKDSEKS